MSPFFLLGGIALMLGIAASSASAAPVNPNDPRTWGPSYDNLTDAEKVALLRQKNLPVSSDPALAARLEGKAVIVPSPAAQNASKKEPVKDPRTMPLKYQKLMAGALSMLTVDTRGNIMGPVTKDALREASQIAGRLDKAGWPDAANTVRKYAQLAAQAVPPPPKEEEVPLPPQMPAELQQRVQRMIQNERDPEKLEGLIKALRQYKDTPEGSMAIQLLKALIVQIESANIQREALEKADEVVKTPAGEVLPEPEPAPAPKPKPAVLEAPKAPIPVPPAPVPQPPAAPKTPVQIAAEDMVMNLKAMQSKYGMPGAKGKEDKAKVSRFQSLAGLGADGMAGPGTIAKAATMGIGELPLVMYWPVSSNRYSVQKYRDALRRLADEAEAQGFTQIANSMRMSAAYERGQAGIVETGPELV